MGGNELITKGSERVRDQAIELEQTWYALMGGQDIPLNLAKMDT